MKLTTITMALAFAAGTLGLGSAASAQDHRAPADQGMRHDEQMRHDDMGRDRATHVRRDTRHYERHDRRSWRQAPRNGRTVWRQHRRTPPGW